MPSAKTVATLIAILAAALAVPTAAWAAEPASPVSEQARGGGHLDPSQMRAARPSDANRLPAGGPGSGARASSGPSGAFEVTGEQSWPLSTHGRLFYAREGEPPDRLYSCSGTVVRSARANVVFTAGHCVFDRESGEFHRDVVFVPAYRDGASPLGQFSARELHAPAGWVFDGDTHYDIGAVSVERPIQRVTGGRRVAFSAPPQQLGRLTLFGYPAEPADRYDGERPIACDSALRRMLSGNGAALLVSAPCDMQRGASGGGWITPAGILVSVVSHGYCSADPRLCNMLWGPYFGDAALRLYREAGTTEPIRMTFRRAPERRTLNRRPGFRVAVDASTPARLECRVDRGPVRPCRPALRLEALDPGRHIFRIRATDQLGRRSILAHRFAVIPR